MTELSTEGTPISEGMSQSQTPFHVGEQQVQERLGVRDIEDWARKVVRPYLPEEHRAFHTAMPFLVVAARDAEHEEFLSEVFGVFHPNKVVAGWPADPQQAAHLDLLQGRQPQPTGGAVFVCRAQACQAPVKSPEGVREALQAARSSSA